MNSFRLSHLFCIGATLLSFSAGAIFADDDLVGNDAFDPIQQASAIAATTADNDAAILSRLGDLEQKWIDFEQSKADEKASASKKPTLHIGGRIHLDSVSFMNTSDGINNFESPLTGDDPENRIFFRRTRIEMQGDVLDTMFYRFQIDFHDAEFGEYKDVYIGWKNLPHNHRVMIGNQKRPLGLDHLNSSRFNVFMERPLAVEAFNPDARRVGIQAVTHTDDEDYSFFYGIFLGENTRTDGTYIGDSAQCSGNFRLVGNPWYDETSGGRGYFHWAIAGMLSKPDGDVGPNVTNRNEARFATRTEIRSNLSWLDTRQIAGADWYEILAFESILNIGPLQITGEYFNTWVQRDDTTAGTGPDTHFHGGYIYAHYMLTGEHIPYKRVAGTIDRLKPFENFFLVDNLCNNCDSVGSGWGAWGIGARLSYLDVSDQDILGGVGTNFTIGLNWWWTAYSKLQVNYVYTDIDQHRPVNGYTSGTADMLTTRVELDF